MLLTRDQTCIVQPSAVPADGALRCYRAICWSCEGSASVLFSSSCSCADSSSGRTAHSLRYRHGPSIVQPTDFMVFGFAMTNHPAIGHSQHLPHLYALIVIFA